MKEQSKPKGQTSLLRGRVWVLRDSNGNRIDDIDTDMIFHNRYLAITDVEKMGRYALDNLVGWEDFSSKAEPGDILIGGRNFGAGSSRQQAVDCFRSLGIVLIVGESFGAIYKRNAVNLGFGLLECPGILSRSETDLQYVRTGDVVEVNIETGDIRNITTGQKIEGGKPFSMVQMDIYRAGDLLAYGKRVDQGD